MADESIIYTIQDIRNAIEECNNIRLRIILQNSNIDLNVNYGEGNGHTPLTQTIELGEGFDSIGPVTSILKLLLKFGADPNMNHSIQNRPPLFFIFEDELLLRILLKGGADASYVHPTRRNPLTQAFFDGNYDLANILTKYGAKKEIVYNSNVVDYGETVENINRFFEECEEYKKALSNPKIKGISRKE